VEEPLVEIVLEEPAWEAALPDLAAVAETAARLAIEATGRDPADWQVSLLACSDDRIAALNAAFRGRRGPTDVLSWPAFAGPPREAPRPRTHLGDVAVALGTTRKDAAEANLPLKDHAIHLILHGCLHLLGHDHGTEEEAGMMEDLERRALARIGLGDPYDRGDADRLHPDG
jgi:probable rRNA maturation factor